MIDFMVNGHYYSTQDNQKLITFLREELNLTSVKNGCSQGACGTCMVLVDGKARKACVIQTNQLAGKKVITVEGLSEREKQVYAYAFAHCGAVQCGFCTPGMVICAKGLLDCNSEPSDQEIRAAIKDNICRCTGYKKIEAAIRLAAELFKNNTAIPASESAVAIGKNLPRLDAVAKILGVAEYVDDMRIEGLLYGSAVRSLRFARARIKSIDITQAQALPGVVAVLTAKDIPGQQKIGHLKKDWDVLIPEGQITHCLGDPIVLIAAKSRSILDAAKALVVIEYEELRPLTSPVEALAADAPLIHETGNVLTEEHLQRGQALAAIRASRFVVTNHYSTPFTDHGFLETEAAIALPDPEDDTVLRVYCADQGIYQTQKECAEMLGVPRDKVRVISKMVGGGFGGKEDMSVQHHAALLAFHTGQPVKVAFTRDESIMVHPKRHAMEMDFTTACDENGFLTAMQADIVADTGAYASLGGPVLQRACTHAAGPYNYQNIDIRGRAVYTNNPPAGAYRGFGVPQSCFASECNLNQLAALVGISPWEIRYRNAIRPGQVLPNGQIADASTALVETLEAVKPYFDANPRSGIACAMKNSGLGVGVPDIGRCTLYIRNRLVEIRTSAACIGQGMATVITQIVGQVTGLLLEQMVFAAPDTLITPDAGNTTASRQTLFTGEAARRAAEALQSALSTQGGDLAALEGRSFVGEYQGLTDKMGSDKPNPISHITYGYATHLVELTEEGYLQRVVAVHDVGKAINPCNIEGQIQGGVVMSLGYALTEDFPLEQGRPKAKFATLGLLKSTQVPEIEALIIEKNQGQLAMGAKGIGEICSIPTPPAVQLAYFNWDGRFRTKLPLEGTPYRK